MGRYRGYGGWIQWLVDRMGRYSGNSGLIPWVVDTVGLYIGYSWLIETMSGRYRGWGVMVDEVSGRYQVDTYMCSSVSSSLCLWWRCLVQPYSLCVCMMFSICVYIWCVSLLSGCIWSVSMTDPLTAHTLSLTSPRLQSNPSLWQGPISVSSFINPVMSLSVIEFSSVIIHPGLLKPWSRQNNE